MIEFERIINVKRVMNISMNKFKVFLKAVKKPINKKTIDINGKKFTDSLLIKLKP